MSHDKFIVNLKLKMYYSVANENNIRGNRISKTTTNYTLKLNNKFLLKIQVHSIYTKCKIIDVLSTKPNQNNRNSNILTLYIKIEQTFNNVYHFNHTYHTNTNL